MPIVTDVGHHLGMKTLILALALLGVAATGQAQTRVETPKPGTPLRKAILDALRVPVQEDLGQPVQFKIDVLRVQNGWAFVRGIPQRTDGGAIDYSGTGYQISIDEGAFDDGFCALLEKQGRTWTVVVYSIGSTGVVWDTWAADFHAPKAIFE